mmetsp:Transcript_43971/g.146540  ORF Transcript_43971/g.146540 Transcript_43971/m.146540 type:complete len:419 (+) Transcript_43971:776-2032(+)
METRGGWKGPSAMRWRIACAAAAKATACTLSDSSTATSVRRGQPETPPTTSASAEQRSMERHTARAAPERAASKSARASRCAVDATSGRKHSDGRCDACAIAAAARSTASVPVSSESCSAYPSKPPPPSSASSGMQARMREMSAPELHAATMPRMQTSCTVWPSEPGGGHGSPAHGAKMPRCTFAFIALASLSSGTPVTSSEGASRKRPIRPVGPRAYAVARVERVSSSTHAARSASATAAAPKTTRRLPAGSTGRRRNHGRSSRWTKYTAAQKSAPPPQTMPRKTATTRTCSSAAERGRSPFHAKSRSRGGLCAARNAHTLPATQPTATAPCKFLTSCGSRRAQSDGWNSHTGAARPAAAAANAWQTPLARSDAARRSPTTVWPAAPKTACSALLEPASRSRPHPPSCSAAARAARG